jgi:hypothetical protein
MIKPIGNPGAGGTLFAGGGKNSVQQDFGSPHSGVMSTITKGEPLSRMMGQYGKGHSFAPQPQAPSMAMGPSKAPKLSTIRGGSGAMKKNVRQGGLGPGPMSTPGTSQDYSMTTPDTE